MNKADVFIQGEVMRLSQRVKILEEQMRLRESEIRYLSKMVDEETGHPERSVATDYDEAIAGLEKEFPGLDFQGGK